MSYTCKYTYVYTHVYTSATTHMSIHMSGHLQVHICPCTCLYTCKYIHVYTHVYACVYADIYTHAAEAESNLASEIKGSALRQLRLNRASCLECNPFTTPPPPQKKKTKFAALELQPERCSPKAHYTCNCAAQLSLHCSSFSFPSGSVTVAGPPHLTSTGL